MAVLNYLYHQVIQLISYGMDDKFSRNLLKA